MSALGALALLTATSLLGAMSPGPSFLMVAHTAAGTSRLAGLAAALGMSVGGATWSASALLGLAAVFQALPHLFLLVRIAGGLYLIWLAIRIWIGATTPLPEARMSAGSLRSAFLRALGTQLSNPKVAVFFASVFVALIPPGAGIGLKLAAVAIVFTCELCWYSVVAWALSGPASRAAYGRMKLWIDRISAAVLALIAARLAGAALAEASVASLLGEWA
jgi:threonine/homoserine/homoserine lactone efflux protein